ncbi:hypothetical protein HDV03_001261 [Kappamyces sp. JEL0829]|nr:hypothetical protein HDV03_001261 [Kappamyces sp. JEL0829]
MQDQIALLKLLVVEERKKHEAEIRNLNEIVRQKKERIKELETIRFYKEQTPVPHDPALNQVTQFKLNRAEREIVRLNKLLLIKGAETGRDCKAVQTEQTMARPQEDLITIRGALGDVVGCFAEMLDGISPKLRLAMAQKGITKDNACSFIAMALSMFQCHANQLQQTVSRMKRAQSSMEQRANALRQEIKGLAALFRETVPNAVDGLPSFEPSLCRTESLLDLYQSHQPSPHHPRPPPLETASFPQTRSRRSSSQRQFVDKDRISRKLQDMINTLSLNQS